MKKVEIKGIAKIEGFISDNNDFGRVEINDVDLEKLVATALLSMEAKEEGKSISETSFCKVSIIIEPYAETLTVNGKDIPLKI